MDILSEAPDRQISVLLTPSEHAAVQLAALLDRRTIEQWIAIAITQKLVDDTVKWRENEPN